MTKLYEITWIGRGGQGAVTASTALAKAAFLDGFKGVQAFPFFGAERRGAPVKAFTRIGDREILDYSQIYRADVLVLFNYKLLNLINLNDELKQGGVLVVNSNNYKLKISDKFDIFVVDADKIAFTLDLIVAGFPIVNTCMLGAFSKATNLVSLENILESVKEIWPEKYLIKNLKATQLAFKNCFKVT